KTLPPYPPYDSCIPISRNIMRGDDPDYLPFIPFSDDPTYDYTYDNDHHKYFAWHKPDRDPDCARYVLPLPDFQVLTLSLLTILVEVIVFETVRKLVVDRDLSYWEIDNTGLLPMLTDRMLKLTRKRDFPKWRPDDQLKPLLPVASNAARPKETVKYFLDRFCNNLNCVTGFCTTHLKTQSPNPVAPKLPYYKLSDSIDAPCGKHCFLQTSTLADSIGTFWTADDMETLFAALDIAPDALPCDLAIICRKPCREVRKGQIRNVRSNTSIIIATIQEYAYNALKSLDSRLPCKHAGPCDATSACACFLTRAHCHTRCGCAKACASGVRRWKGCSCAKSAKVCGTKKCSCFRQFVECDPEVCLQCEAKWSELTPDFVSLDMHSNLCRNVGIQRGRFKDTEVRESRWGLGLFMAESCEKGDLVTEYVGELIYNPTVRSRDGIATHKGRSYIFDLNRRIAVDSAYAGNGTRYINHSSHPNCDTAVFLVNGEHRIGVYAGK
ncbi:hypothetical protein BDZ97DRAFT_1652502, partial [Flammula alnicola]